MIVFSGTSKLAIQAAYSQKNCGGGTANNDAFVVSAVSNLNNIYRVACVASVSNRVLARKLERKPLPLPRSFFFCSCPSFLNEPREETLATQAITEGKFRSVNPFIC